MTVNPSSNVIFVKLLQFVNIFDTAPCFNVFGIFILVSAVQFLNTANDNDSIFPKFTSFKFVQSVKALYSIVFTLSGTTTPVIFEAPLKALSPIVTTSFPSIRPGIVTFPVNSLLLVHFKFSILFSSFKLYVKFAVTPLILQLYVYSSAANITLVPKKVLKHAIIARHIKDNVKFFLFFILYPPSLNNFYKK